MNKKMKNISNHLLLVFGLVFLGACSTASKVLVDHSFRGKTKTSKIMLEQSGETGGKILYSNYVRLCDIKDFKETSCKDTVVLDNVVADTIY
jgi:hypothetical protein